MNVSQMGLLVRAFTRARVAILTIAATHILGIIVGMVMVHSGNEFALSYRDDLVGRAQTSPILVALHDGNPLWAALLDFGGNLFAAVANMLGGLGIVFPYPVTAYRGWIGGIVSVDSTHTSRLATFSEGAYYLITLTLQLIPYSLAVGAGVNVGIAYFRPPDYYQGQKWLGIPKEAVLDALRICLLVIPLFLIASLWEFLMR